MKVITMLMALCLFSTASLLAQQKESTKSSIDNTSQHPVDSLATPVPTFIVNGVIIPTDKNGKIPKLIAELNPSEILYVEVIKGESAVARYGDASKNGVVLITTRKQ